MLLRVAFKVNFHTFRKKTLATSATTATQDIATIDRLGTGAVTELLLASTLGRLVSAFGHGAWD